MRPKARPTKMQNALRRRYQYLRLCQRCVQCTKRLPDGWKKARCPTCGKRNQSARTDARATRKPSDGCPRCYLRGSHQCLPTSAVAYIRGGAGPLYPANE